jgi:SpoVK/Ycf46/Vps4 family AAA+-type ATPase
VVIADVASQVAHAGTGPRGLWAACRAQTRPRLDTFARRVQPVASWDDLVLPDAEVTLLHHIVDQVRGRGQVLRSWGLAERITRGSAVTALFAGGSGTGKTLAAEVIANELELDMYRIDLAGVVSKYIGETEQNLRRVFDAAEEGGALLMFDEADALFGKRSEVRDSHDRYANIEISYLLARMEDYRGVAILASNLRHALDDAFLRRLRFVITFPFPGPAERARLWAQAFPAKAPVAELDIERLAKLAASGGTIRNIALNAAFCAAGRGTEITMELVLEMARIEFRKLERHVSDADFTVQAATA